VVCKSAEDPGGQLETDHLNTPRLVADATGTTVWRWDQAEPFGNNPADEDPDGNSVAFDLPLRLPGQRYDKETALHYNYFRDYDPGLGRYAESDPIGLRGGVNTYAYVSNSPIIYVDVDGLLKWSGRFELEFIGYRIGGGVRGQFKLESECDVDGKRGIADVAVHGFVNIGIPASARLKGSAKFVDGQIRAVEEALRGRFHMRSFGIVAGPLDLSAETIFLGEAVSTEVKVDGFRVNAQFTAKGFADVLSFRLETCACRTQ